MGFTGLTPSEYSSGAGTRRGGITKAGPQLVRSTLIESAWAYRHQARDRGHAGAPPAGRLPGNPRQVLEDAAAAARHLAEDGRPRQAPRRHGHRRRPRARGLRLGRDDQLTVRPATRPAACRETTPRQEMIPASVMSEPNLARSEGQRPASSRPATPTREYEPGSGDSHDHAPARRPYQPRPPPRPGRRARSPRGSPPRGQPATPARNATPATPNTAKTTQPQTHQQGLTGRFI